MSEQRKMTIARALTRLKTIKAQLQKINNDIGNYGAISSKSRSPLGDPKASLDKNHNQAIEHIRSLYQQFEDLTKEYIKIKTAIDKANMQTIITVANKTMTIQEALVYRRDISKFVQELLGKYGQAVNRATDEVYRHNASIKTDGMDEAAVKVVLSEVLYLVPKEKIQESENFLTAFLVELDGILNEVNAITEIEI
jgi:hypothetical protein